MPQDIEYMDKLPKTRSGKIMRRLLHAKEWGEEIGDIPPSKMINPSKKGFAYFNLNIYFMEKINLEEMKDLVLNYVISEYIEDEDEKITYDTPLISSGYVDSFSMVSLLVFLKTSSKLRSTEQSHSRCI